MFNKVWMAGAIFLLGAGAVKASFFSDLLKAPMVKAVEQREIAAAPDCTLTADEALSRAIDLLSDGRQAEAEDLIKSAAKSYRDDIRILFAKAVLERSRYNKDAADAWFAMARKAKGAKHLSQASWLSMQLDRKKSVDENLAELICLSNENPDNIFLLWLGAMQCREQSKQDDVIAIAELGCERYEMLLKKFRVGPVMLHQFYANILAETLKNYEKAMEHRVLAVSLEAKGWSLYGLGNTLVGMGNYEWGSAVLARTVRTNPRSAKYVNRWGDAFYRLKRYDEAEEKYRKAVELDPKTWFWWDDLADCLRKLEKNKEAVECYQRAVELGGNVFDNLAYCYHFGYGVEKDEKKAFELYRLYKEKNLESAWVHHKLGYCYSSGVGVEKDPVQARTYFEEAVRLDNNHSDALNALAWELATCKDLGQRDYPRAIKLVKRSVEQDENSYNLDTLAVTYYNSGRYEEALKAVDLQIRFYQSRNPNKPVPQHLINRGEKYKEALGGLGK